MLLVFDILLLGTNFYQLVTLVEINYLGSWEIFLAILVINATHVPEQFEKIIYIHVYMS